MSRLTGCVASCGNDWLGSRCGSRRGGHLPGARGRNALGRLRGLGRRQEGGRLHRPRARPAVRRARSGTSAGRTRSPISTWRAGPRCGSRRRGRCADTVVRPAVGRRPAEARGRPHARLHAGRPAQAEHRAGRQEGAAAAVRQSARSRRAQAGRRGRDLLRPGHPQAGPDRRGQAARRSTWPAARS